jgi:hypothetical protein
MGEWNDSSTHPESHQEMEVNCQLHASALYPGEEAPDMRLGGPQSRFGRGGIQKNPYSCRESNKNNHVIDKFCKHLTSTVLEVN